MIKPPPIPPLSLRSRPVNHGIDYIELIKKHGDTIDTLKEIMTELRVKGIVLNIHKDGPILESNELNKTGKPITD